MPIYASPGLGGVSPGVGAPIGQYNIYPGASIGTTAIGVGTFQVVPLQLEASALVSSFDVFLSNSYSATNAGSSMAHTLSFTAGVYSRTGSSLSLASSSSVTTAFTVTGSSSSVSYQGFKNFGIPVALAMTPGNWWLAYISSTASAGNAIAGGFSNGIISYPGAESAYQGVFGSSTNVSQQVQMGWGQYSVSSAALPGSVGFSELIGSVVSNTVPLIHLRSYSA
jgi:hypothetical protein